MSSSLASIDYFTGFGEAFQYSNQIVATAGYATAVALDSDWEAMADGYRQEMNQHVFQPIGMSRTTLDFGSATSAPNSVLSHVRRLDGSYTQGSIDDERFVVPVAPAG